MEVAIDDAQWREIGAALDGIKNGVPKVLTRATNKTLTTVKSETAKAVYAELNLTQKEIKKNIKLKKMSWTELKAWVKSTGKPRNLTDFIGTKQGAKGVSVKVKRSSKRSILSHAFIAMGSRSSKRLVGRREYKGARVPIRTGASYTTLPKKYRYPVKWLTGPRVEDIIAKIYKLDATMDKYSKTYLKNINHELEYELSKL